MAHKQQGNLTKNPQWWKHLREFKRAFWKNERQAHKKEITQDYRYNEGVKSND
jgi:hypothetical protein